MSTHFTPRPVWQIVRSLGSIGIHKNAELRLTHVRHNEHGAEAVELRLVYHLRDGDHNESLMRIDKTAIPALVRLLSTLTT
jgi:hypothetical protein